MPHFLRFEMLTKDVSTGWPEGLFVAAYKVARLEVGEVESYHLEAIENLIGWFGDNLETPTRFNSTASKGYRRRVAAGVSWFKANALSHIAKMRELAAILREYGFSVIERTTDRPGRVVYEDEFQIVAEPFRSET
jgi:hypothetical protein